MDTLTNTIKQFPYSEKVGSPRLNEHIWFWGLFWATVVVIYFLPKMVDYVYMLIVFLLFVRSRQDYFWLAFFILITNAPFGFFTEGSSTAAHRLPLFSFGGGLSFSTPLIFLFIGLAKALVKNNRVDSYFSRHYIVFIFYMAFLIAIAFIVHGTGLDVFLDTIKKAFGLSFIFIIYKLIDNREDKYKFVFLLLPFVFLILADAFYFLITGGDYIYNIFNPSHFRRSINLGVETTSGLNARYLVSGFQLLYFIFIFSLSFAFTARKKNYFILAALSAFIVVITGALRSWFVIFSIALLFFIYYSPGKIKSTLAIAVLFLLLMLPVMHASTGSKAFEGAWSRISTVFDLGESSSASTQTIQMRLTEDLPKQFSLIEKNPLTGWAFTGKWGNVDTGNFALIVDTGFVGFLIFLWFWFSYIHILRQHIKILKSKESRNALKMLIVLFLGTLLSHFTTNALFLFYTGIFMGTIVFLSEFILSEAKLYDQQQVETW